MNQLNSLIFEGVVQSVSHTDGVLHRTDIILDHYRFDELETGFKVSCFGVMADKLKSLQKDRSIRVVGRLAHTGEIIAEHIEIKSVPHVETDGSVKND